MTKTNISDLNTRFIVIGRVKYMLVPAGLNNSVDVELNVDYPMLVETDGLTFVSFMLRLRK